MPASAQTGTAINAQSTYEIRSRCDERRRDAEKYTGQHGESDREDEDSGVDMNIRGTRETRGRQGHEAANAPLGQRHAADAARQTQKDALRQKLPDYAPAAR